MLRNLTQGCLRHPGVPQTPRLSTFCSVELIFPSCQPSLLTGIWWVAQNPVIIHFLLQKMEFSSPSSAESRQSESLG